MDWRDSCLSNPYLALYWVLNICLQSPARLEHRFDFLGKVFLYGLFNLFSQWLTFQNYKKLFLSAKQFYRLKGLYVYPVKFKSQSLEHDSTI